MQTKPLPPTNTSSAYFSRKLSLYTVAFYLSSKWTKKLFQQWSELCWNKSSIEMGVYSFTYNKWMNTRNKTKIFIQSDSWPWQNKNSTILSLLVYWYLIFKKETIIYFPERSHLFVVTDRVFDKIKLFKKNRKILSEEYEENFNKVGDVLRFKKDFYFYALKLFWGDMQ